MLSSVDFSSVSPSLISLSPAVVNVFSKSSGLLLKSFLHRVKNPHTASEAKADPLQAWAPYGYNPSIRK